MESSEPGASYGPKGATPDITIMWYEGAHGHIINFRGWRALAVYAAKQAPPKRRKCKPPRKKG